MPVEIMSVPLSQHMRAVCVQIIWQIEPCDWADEYKMSSLFPLKLNINYPDTFYFLPGVIHVVILKHKLQLK